MQIATNFKKKKFRNFTIFTWFPRDFQVTRKNLVFRFNFFCETYVTFFIYILWFNWIFCLNDSLQLSEIFRCLTQMNKIVFILPTWTVNLRNLFMKLEHLLNIHFNLCSVWQLPGWSKIGCCIRKWRQCRNRIHGQFVVQLQRQHLIVQLWCSRILWRAQIESKLGSEKQNLPLFWWWSRQRTVRCDNQRCSDKHDRICSLPLGHQRWKIWCNWKDVFECSWSVF